jgi:hypothetical protein
MSSFDEFINKCKNNSKNIPKLPNKIPTQQNVSDIIECFCQSRYSFSDYDEYSNDKYECLLKLIKHVSPSYASITKFLMKIKKNTTYSNIKTKKCFEFIDYLYFDREFKFNQTQLNLLETINYYIDTKIVIKNNKKVCSTMFPFCFNMNTKNININNIKTIMQNNKLVLNKSCLNLLLLNFNNNDFIEYINFFINNKYVFDDDDISNIFCSLENTNNVNPLQNTNCIVDLLNIFSSKINGIIFEKICMKSILNAYDILLFFDEYKKQKFIINTDNLKQILYSLKKYDDNNNIYKITKKFIILLFNVSEFTIDNNIVTHMYSLKFDINFIKLFESKINHNLISENNINLTFIKCIENGDICRVKQIVGNKFIPKVEHLYYLQPNSQDNNYTEIVKFFVGLKSLGIIIDDKIYIYLVMINVPLLEEINFPDVSPELKKTMECKNKLINKNVKNINKNFTVKTMDQLRKLFGHGKLEDLIKYTNSNNKLVPDELCFFNSLQNTFDVIKFVLDKYNYVPSIYDIMFLKKSEVKIYLLGRFHSNCLSNI